MTRGMGGGSMGGPGTRAGPVADPHPPSPGQGRSRLSLWMLAVFVPWTVLFIVLSGPVARLLGAPMSGGEVAYVEAWVPWVVITAVWLLPLLAGLALALDARRRDPRDGLARVALVLHAVIMVVMAGPSLLDRLLHLG